MDTSYTIEQRRDIAARLNTSTKATATKVGQLTKELSESGYDLLSPAEVSALGEVCGFLRGLGEATSEAYTRTKTLSKKLSAVEAKRWKIVSEAMRETGLATMTDMESVQWRLHMLGPKRSVHDRDYDLQKLRDNRLDSFDAWSLRYDVKSVREIVHEDLGSDLFARLKADPALESSAAVILRERIHGFEEARAQLVEQHRPFIEHVQALLTAEALERAEKANNHGKT